MKPHALYSPLPIPDSPWFDISMEFVLVCHGLKEGKILFLFLLIEFPQWLNLFLVKRLIMFTM